MKHSCGNINRCFPVCLLFANFGKHCCGSKICFTANKNIFQQGNTSSVSMCSLILIEEALFLYVSPDVSSAKNVVFVIRHECAGNNLSFVRANVSHKKCCLVCSIGKHDKTLTGNKYLSAIVILSLPKD